MNKIIERTGADTVMKYMISRFYYYYYYYHQSGLSVHCA